MPAMDGAGHHRIAVTPAQEEIAAAQPAERSPLAATPSGPIPQSTAHQDEEEEGAAAGGERSNVPDSSATTALVAVTKRPKLLRRVTTMYLPGPRQRVIMWQRGQLMIITVAMGTLEVNSPRVLGVFTTACTLVVVGSLYVHHGALDAIVFSALSACVVVRLRRGVRSIEEMDEYGKKYAEADATHLSGGGGDLGPAPMKLVDVVCQTDLAIADNLGRLRARAIELSKPFEAEVLEVLAAAVPVAGSPPHEQLGPNVKGQGARTLARENQNGLR